MKTIAPVAFRPAPAKIVGPNIVRTSQVRQGEVVVCEAAHRITPDWYQEQMAKAADRQQYRPK